MQDLPDSEEVLNLLDSGASIPNQDVESVLEELLGKQDMQDMQDLLDSEEVQSIQPSENLQTIPSPSNLQTTSDHDILLPIRPLEEIPVESALENSETLPILPPENKLPVIVWKRNEVGSIIAPRPDGRTV